MKRGWTRFWRGASVWLLLPATVFTAGSAPALRLATGIFQALPGTAKRANELELAGLHPGRDALAAAVKLYGNGVLPALDDDKVVTWQDACRGQSLRVEADAGGVIQFITVQADDHPGDCSKRADSRARVNPWRTGHGLAISDSRARVIALYGSPNSGGPSTGDHRQLDMLYYAFDWAGSDVPQVMEVYCDRVSGKVVEIVLSGPSL